MKKLVLSALLFLVPLFSHANYDATLADLVVSGDPMEFNETRSLAVNTEGVVFRVTVQGCDQVGFSSTQVACRRNGQTIVIGDIVGNSFTVDGDLGYDEMAQVVRIKPGINADLKLNTAQKNVSYILTIK